MSGTGVTGKGRWLVFLGPLLLAIVCFGPAAVEGRRLAFRDASQFYDPLHRRIQQQWASGRLPAWEPGEDGGRPLLGNPTAAVLYPGKLVFAALPFDDASRAYTIAHVLLACGAMAALLRGWGVGPAGAAIGAMAYGFGGPVLGQYANGIYLVGAAWMPLGLRAADRWLRLGRRRGIAELAVVLAMQALGGDLQAAYLTGLAAAGYAFVPGVGGDRTGLPARLRALAIGGAGLAVAAGLALVLGAAQLLPVADNLAGSARWEEDRTDDREAFSVEPYRAVELLWPDAFGRMFRGDRYWLMALPPREAHRIWAASLYLGTLTWILAAAGFGLREGPPWRAWMSLTAAIAAIAACGQFLDPGWLGLGPIPGPYRLLATILPGFGAFRYPGKLTALATLAIAALAGLGWDRVVAGRSRLAGRWAAGGAIAGVVVGLALVVGRGTFAAMLRDSDLGRSGNVFGPFDPAGAWLDTFGGVVHGTVASLVALAVIRTVARRPAIASVLAVAALAIDLAVAQPGLILTIPDADFARDPALAVVLARDESDAPDGGPHRIFRLRDWIPRGWGARTSADRPREITLWERDTLRPYHGVPFEVNYTFADVSGLESNAFARQFEPFRTRIDAATAAGVGARPGQEVIGYPRHAFDLWGTRYFVLPVDPGDWSQTNRGFLAFLDATESVPIPPEARRDDVQIRRNLDAFPHAWVVHEAAVDLGDAFDRWLLRGGAADPAESPPSLDPRRTAWLEAPCPIPLDGGPPDDSERPEVRILGPDRATVRVELTRPGIVILADRIERGWSATVDGRPAPILRANRAMRALALGAGPHEIAFDYEPPGFRLGLALSAAGLVGLVAAGLVARRRALRP